MPKNLIFVEENKYMWDGISYESKNEAQDIMQKYKDDNFQVELVEEEGKFFLYTRRIVTEIVVEGEPTV